MREHDAEPIRGLPERPPAGEVILWQGAPQWRLLAAHVFHIRVLAAYIFGLWLVSTVSAVSAGEVSGPDCLRMAEYLALALVAIGLVAGFAWAIGRTTIYTVTNRRLVLRFGIALSKTINLPFAQIDGANLRSASGDVSVQLRPDHRVAFLVLWPHVRPWRVTRCEPMLRALPDAVAVAQILGRALAASADQAAQPVRLPAGSVVPAGAVAA